MSPPPLHNGQISRVAVDTKLRVTPPPNRQTPQHRGAARSRQPLPMKQLDRSSPPFGSSPVSWAGEGEEEQQKGVGMAWEVDLSDSRSLKKSPPQNLRSAQHLGSQTDGKKRLVSGAQQQHVVPSPTSTLAEHDSLEQSTESPAHPGPRLATCPQDIARRKVFDMQRW